MALPRKTASKLPPAPPIGPGRVSASVLARLQKTEEVREDVADSLPLPDKPQGASPVKKASSKAAAKTKPAQPQEESSSLSDDTMRASYVALGDGWFQDKKTGKKFKKLGATVFGPVNADGFADPKLENPDFDETDLNGEASKFLAHLQVAPTKEELEAYREEYARKQRDRKAREEAARKERAEETLGE